MTSSVPTRRPAVVTFIGTIQYIQGFLAAVAAISLLISRNDVVDYLERRARRSPARRGTAR